MGVGVFVGPGVLVGPGVGVGKLGVGVGVFVGPGVIGARVGVGGRGVGVRVGVRVTICPFFTCRFPNGSLFEGSVRMLLFLSGFAVDW